MRNFLFFAVVAVIVSNCVVSGEVPNEIHYQGRLREYGQPITGNRTMNFKIYAVETGGVPVWSSGDVIVSVTTGTFSYTLSPSGVDWRWKDFWVETTVSGKILAPREKIAAGVYAFHARTTEDISKTSGTITITIGNVPVISISTFALIASNLTVSVATPTADSHATTKSYVDSVVSGGGGLGSFNTLTVSSNTALGHNGGLVNVGTSNLTSARLVVEPANTISIDARQGKIINVSTPAAVLDAANKGYVDTWLPPGTILMWGGSQASIPAGWLLCDGSAVSRTTYARLFAAIGTVHGVGDGVTTFNLPNLRDRFIVGAGSSYAVGATGGATSHSHTVDSHAHTIAHTHTMAHTHTFSGTTSTIYQFTGPVNLLASGGAGDHNHTFSGTTSGGSTETTSGASATNSGNASPGTNAVSNLPPYYALCYIIKY